MDYAGSCNECAVFCAHGLLKSTHGKYFGWACISVNFTLYFVLVGVSLTQSYSNYVDNIYVIYAIRRGK